MSETAPPAGGPTGRVMAEYITSRYRVIEMIGRGGMGVIYKAHDTKLDRLVALKVISPDVEITDQLRARFEREAKACGRLNHPNIVTVHDYGEDQGRLFIAMELLEGRELRQIIRAREPMTLEDKLAVMEQVCAGLHYAHRQDIVHRDIKPGNIFLVEQRRAKILDFGIAYMRNTDADLTRTGWFMGTWRYSAPEQAQGIADKRSDMFSVGSVFYELLTLRPAFDGDAPMQLMEQLRNAEPTPPSEIDGDIPPELTSLVQRAMRKNPDDRFADLAVMAREIERIQRRLNAERQQIEARVSNGRERLHRLETTLAELVGGAVGHDEETAILEAAGVVAARAAERHVAERIGAVEAAIGRAEAAAPALRLADASLEAGQIGEAVARLEAIVANVPEHRYARERLDRAHAAADDERVQRRGVELGERARAAADGRRYALCLKLLDEALALSLPAHIVVELGRLRQVALNEYEALAAVRHEAERAREQMVRVRSGAQAEDASRHAPDIWHAAETLAAEAEASLGREAYAEARQGYERALADYGRCAEAARQIRTEVRRSAEGARMEAVESRDRAQTAGAAFRAPEQWEAAAARFVDAETVFSQGVADHGRALFDEAGRLFTTSLEAAGIAAQREAIVPTAEPVAPAADLTAADELTITIAVGEETRMAGPAAAAPVTPRSPEVADDVTIGPIPSADLRRRRRIPRRLGLTLVGVAGLAAIGLGVVYWRPTPIGGDVVVKQLAIAVKSEREAATKAGSHDRAPARFNDALQRERAGEDALKRGDMATAKQQFGQALDAYRLATKEVIAEAAREKAARTAEEQTARTAEEQTAAARQTAVANGAPRLAATLWKSGEAAQERATEALKRRASGSALALFDEARRAYEGATIEARTKSSPSEEPSQTARNRDQKAAEKAARDALDARQMAVQAGAPTLSPEAFEGARRREQEGETALKRQLFASATQRFSEAQQGYKTATDASNTATTHRRQLQGQAEAAKSLMKSARNGAESAGAERYASSSPLLDRAGAKEREADTLFAGHDHAGAVRVFGEARVEYERAEAQAKLQATQRDQQRSQAEHAKALMDETRLAAQQAGAAQYAQLAFDSARTREREAGGAFSRPDYPMATRLFGEARERYQTAMLEARTEQANKSLRDRMEAARSRAQRARSDVGAEAGQLARGVVETAQRKQSEAQEAGQNFARAEQLYDEAAGLYIQAKHQGEGLVQAKRQAESAKKQMREEKSRANSAAPGYVTAEASEREADRLYDRSAFNDAAVKYQTTQELYAKAKLAAEPPASTGPKSPYRLPPIMP